MAAIEILACNGIQNAFKEFGIKAKRTYKMSHEPYYEVWELDKRDLKVLNNCGEWMDSWGWFRHAKGSNMGSACSFFMVNGYELIAWDGDMRDELLNRWCDESNEVKKEYNYSFKKYEEFWMPHAYRTLLEYMYNEIGASTASNVCALAIDLARANRMSMAKLFEIFEG